MHTQGGEALVSEDASQAITAYLARRRFDDSALATTEALGYRNW